MPRADVAGGVLFESGRTTRSPSRGTATLFDVKHGNPSPTRESAPIAGLVAFRDERVDLTVGGVPQRRPKSPFA